MNRKLEALARLTSDAVVLALAIAMAVPPAPAFAGDLSGISAGNISAGDTAKAAPDVKTMCDSINSALSGDFAKSGFMTVKPECESKSLRQRVAQECQTDRGTELVGLSEEKKQAKLDEFCSGGATSLTGDNATYCAIRNATKGGQAKEYCDAYESADQAQKGVTITALLDVAAAGTCWAEALTMQKLAQNWTQQFQAAKKEYDTLHAKDPTPAPEYTKMDFASSGKYMPPKDAMGPGSIFNKGICGGAAMAAGAAELVQTARILMGNHHSSGDYKINSDNGVDPKKNVAKIVEVVLSAGMSLAALKLGICYYKTGDADGAYRSARKPGTLGKDDKGDTGGFCADLNNSSRLGKSQANVRNLGSANADLNSATENQSDAEFKLGAAYVVRGMSHGAIDKVDAQSKELEKAKNAVTAARGKVGDVYASFVARGNLAKQAAMLFSGLAAMRAVSLISASSTKNKAKEILQSMFTSGNGTLSMGAATGGNASTSIFTSTGTSSFSSTTGTQPVKSSAMAAGTPESFLLPPGSPTANIAEQLGSQIPPKKLEEAASAGASGMGGLVASVASGLGARDTGEIHGAMASMFANLPKDDGAGYTGGGGKSLAKSGGDTGGDLNLKSLFGAGDKEERAGAAAAGLAFRGPASDDIWHSQNPKGNNLFQIVSDRYDNTIRRQDLSP